MALLDRGRALADRLAARYGERAELKGAAELAFRRGDAEEEERLEARSRALGQEIHRDWRDLQSLAAQLEAQAQECEDELHREQAAAGVTVEPPPQTARDRPGDIEAYLRYFAVVERAVLASSEQLLAVRREAVADLREALQAELTALGRLGERLEAIETALHEETYLDLPTADARRRLSEERLLVQGRAEELRRARREAELARRREQARAALSGLVLAAQESAGTTADVASLVSTASSLLEHGEPEDRLQFWQAVAAVLRPDSRRRPPPAAVTVIAELLLTHVVAPLLGGEVEPSALDLGRVEARDALDTAAAAAVAERPSAPPGLDLSGLVALKQILPRTGVQCLQARPGPTDAAQLADFYLAPPWDHPGRGLPWLAQRFEDFGLWAAASATWQAAGSKWRGLAARTRLIALAQQRFVPADESAWTVAVASCPVDDDGDALDIVAAALVLAARVELTRPTLEGVLRGRLRTVDAQVARAVELCIRFHPVPPAVALTPYREAARALARAHEQIRHLLDNPRSAAGGLWREFCRVHLAPQLRQEYGKGLAVLRDLGRLDSEVFVRQIKQTTRMSANEMNSAAHEQIIGYLDEIRVAAAVGAEAEAATASERARFAGLFAPNEEPDQVVDTLQASLAALGDASDCPRTRWACDVLHRFLTKSPESFSRDQESDQVLDALASDQKIGHAPRVKVSRSGDSSWPNTRFSAESLATALYYDNPVVVLAREPRSVPADDLLLGVLHQLQAPTELQRWGVMLMAERGRFDLVPGYLSALPDAVRGPLAADVAAQRQRQEQALDERLQTLLDLRQTLEIQRDWAAVEAELDEVAVARGRHELDLARGLIDAAYRSYNDAAERQRRRREAAARALGEVVREGVERMARSRDGAASTALRLLSASVALAGRLDVEELEQWTLLAQEKLDGRTLTDEEEVALRDLLDRAPAAAASRPSASPSPPTPRPPADLKRLPKLVQLEIEGLSAKIQRSRPPPRPTGDVAAGRDDLLALVVRYVDARTAGGDWEEPLVGILEQRGLATFEEGNFLRAADYFQATAYVAYCAAARLSRGLDPARSGATNFLIARLRRLRRSSGQDGGERTPVTLASMRDWVDLVRDFLLLQSSGDLVDLLGELMRVAPELTREMLELPLSELRPLQSVLQSRLFDRVERRIDGDEALLDFVLAWGLAREAAAQVRPFISGLHQTIGDLRDGGGDPNRAIELDAKLQAMLREAPKLPLAEPAVQSLQQAIRRLLDDGARRDDLDGVKLNVSALTKTIHLDAFAAGRPVPVYLRVSLVSESPPLRDVSLRIHLDDPLLAVTPDTQSHKLPQALIHGEPVEIACLLARRQDVAAPPPRGQVELTLEIRDVGVMRGGVLRALDVRGAELRVTLDPRDYPHGKGRNPYSPGPALQDLSMIKGRDEVVRELLDKLRGAHRDNVPLIWGARRIGKTTLLYRVKRDPEVRRFYVPILLDMENLVRESDSTRRFLARLAQRIIADLRGTPLGRLPEPDIRGAADPYDAFEDFLARLIAACGEQALLLMFDEMDRFFSILRDHAARPDYGDPDAALHENILRTWRHHMQHTPKLSFLLAGTRELRDHAGQIGERLFQLPIPIHLEELHERDIEDLITQPTQKYFEITPIARKRLSALTAGHPYLTQAVCHHLFSHVTQSRLTICSVRELDEVIDTRVLREPIYFSFQTDFLRQEPRRWAVVRAVAELTSETRRTDAANVTSRIALGKEPLTEAQVQIALDELVRAEVLISWRGGYRFRYPLLGRFIVGPGEKALQ